jgi:protein Mpv17
MERKFPGYTPGYNGDLSLDRVNTVKKFMLDQTIGTIVNTVLFIVGIGALKGKDRHAIFRDVDRVLLRFCFQERHGANNKQDFWPLIRSGWKLWPMVSLVNFVLVPVDQRILVGSIVGLFWGIYLSLFVARDDPEPATKLNDIHLS